MGRDHGGLRDISAGNTRWRVGVGRRAADASGIAGTATGPTGYMGDCIARRDLPARMVSPMEGDCRERGFMKESGAHARMEGAPRCEIAEGERHDAGLPRRSGGRARAGACRGEETATRRGGEGRSRRGGDLVGLRGQGAGLREGERDTREDGGGTAMRDCRGERRDVGLRRRAGGRGRASACRGEETAARRGGEGRSRRGGEGISPACAGWRAGACGRGEGTRGRGHASADLAGLRGMEEEAGGSAMAKPKLWTPTVKA
jgi:hypothetical protein